MIVYRVLHKLVTDFLTGSGNEGRWCTGGRKVIYTSSSISLACLENILRRSGSGFSTHFQTIFYQLPDDLQIEEVLIKELKPDWRLRSNYSYCQGIGHTWHNKSDSLVLKVPSAIIPDEFNYVIKTSASATEKIKVDKIKPFIPDERLEKLLQSVDIVKLSTLS